jgi:hypothetical protein
MILRLFNDVPLTAEDTWRTTEWKYNERLAGTNAWFVLFAQYCLGDQSKEDEVGGACGAHGGGEGCIQHFGWEA